MSFEEILRQWEERKKDEQGERARKRREQLESLLDRYPPNPSAREDDAAEEAPVRPGPNPRMLPIDDEIDLHGMTVDEALAAVGRFLEASRAAGHRKVLVVHGKGLHSENGGVLKAAVRRFLEKHPDTGAMGTPKKRDGGSGALWVVLRQRSR